MTLAHGIGEVGGLPLPGELVLQTGGVVVLLSFLAVALLRKEPRHTGPVGGRAVPALPGGVVTALRAAVLVLAAAVVAVGFLGPQDPDANPAPRALHVLLWVGLVPASLLLGPVWRVLDPLRLLHRLLAAATGVPVTGAVPLPAWGYRPAVVGLAAYVWLELVAPGRDRPAVVVGFLLAWAVVHVGAALRYGEGWFDRGEAFEVYSALAGALSPLDVAEGRLRHPLRALGAVPVAPGLVAFVALWWGSTVFDGVSSLAGWAAVRAAAPLPSVLLPPVLLDTAALALLVVLVALLYRAATGALAAPLVTTLVPVAVGYTVAHYAVLLLVEGPRGVAQLGGAVLGPVTAAPAPVLVAAVQVGAILVGHVVAVVAAHDRSTALLPAHRRLADQVPLVLLMVVYTMVGLLLLTG